MSSSVHLPPAMQHTPSSPSGILEAAAICRGVISYTSGKLLLHGAILTPEQYFRILSIVYAGEKTTAL